MSNNKKLKTSSKVPPIDIICSNCNGAYFSNDGAKRQHDVLKNLGGIPSDCVDSSIGGHKCPFITGAAYERGNHTHEIPKHGDGSYKVPTLV